MNELRVFQNPELGEVRMIMIDDKPYFVGNDVARILQYSRPNDAISANCKGAVIYRIHTPGGMQNAKVIPEGDMYRLIVKAAVQSNSEKVRKAAEKFEKWIFDEVIPEIRKTGAYSIQQKPDSYMIDDKVERAKRWIEEQEEKNREIQIRDDRITELEPKAMICDEMISSNMLMNFRDAAYILGISQSQFTGWLEENGYVYRNADNLLRPTEKYRNSGLFEVKPFKSRSSYYTGAQTHITAKGMAVFKVILNSAGHTQDTLPKHGGRNGRKKR